MHVNQQLTRNRILATALHLCLTEVPAVHLRFALPLAIFGFILSGPLFAQKAPDGALPAPLLPMANRNQAPGLVGPQMAIVTQSSRIRAFNAGPDGLVRSLFLQNGNVVNVSPDLGRQLSTQAHQGSRIRVTGARSVVNGQGIIMANQITVNSQTYTAQLERGSGGDLNDGPDAGPRVGPNGGRGRMQPPPPDARVNGPEGPHGPRLERGPGALPQPPVGAEVPNASGRNAPPPPPNQSAPVTPPNGSVQRTVPSPPAAPAVPAGQQGANPIPAQAPGTTLPPPQPPPSL